MAATDDVDVDKPSLALEDAPLAAALSRSPNGRYRYGGAWWRYASTAIEATPWRLSATVREKALYSSMAGSEITGRVSLGGAAVIGLGVVAGAGRVRAGRRRLRLSEHRFRPVFDSSNIGMVLTGLYRVRQLAQAGGLDIGYEPHQPTGAVLTVTAPRTSSAPEFHASADDMAAPTL